MFQLQIKRRGRMLKIFGLVYENAQNVNRILMSVSNPYSHIMKGAFWDLGAQLERKEVKSSTFEFLLIEPSSTSEFAVVVRGGGLVPGIRPASLSGMKIQMIIEKVQLGAIKS